MDDDFNLVQLLTSYWGFALGIAVTFYTSTVFIGKHLAPGPKENLSLWLMGAYESTWSHHFCNLFDTVFGQKHLSLKCFIRSSLASLIVVFVLYFLFSSVLGVLGTRAFGEMDLLQALLLGAAINILPDYLSLFETRWLLKRFEKVTSIPGQLAVLVADAVFTGTIILIGIYLFQLIRGDEPLSAVEILGLFSVFSIFFYSTFLTSIWAWLYCLSTWFMRLFSRTPLKTLLDVEKRPMVMIALIGSGLLFSGTFALSPVLQAENKRSITLLDEKLCDWFPGDICDHLGRMSKDDKRALNYLAHACEGGAVEHCMDAALKYYKGDDSKAAQLWKKACDSGDVKGCTNLGYMYEKGKGVPQDNKQAVALYKKGCDGGNARGCSNLGVMYDEGKGVLQDYKQAIALYKQGCKGGSALGCSNLGIMYENGIGVLQDNKRAVALYKQGCKGGSALGCSNLGFMYRNAKGVPQDNKQAVALYKQGCDGGNAVGCTNLGYMHEEGKGVPQDNKQAVALYKQGCDGGNARGCSYLGDMYENAKGILQDNKQAMALYKRGCDGGDKWGCDRLK